MPGGFDFRDVPGIKATYTRSGGLCQPPDRRIEETIAGCISLGAEALIIDTTEGAVVVAGDAYEGIYIAAECAKSINAKAIVRIMMARLSEGRLGITAKEVLPAETVRSTLATWEWKISLVFGRKFANRLIESATGDMKPSSMTCDDLQAVRRAISLKTGGCIDLLMGS
jgi:hypothetical protein